MNYFSKKVSLTVLLSVLIIATGCQAIGGVDLNKVFVNRVMVDSVEGNMSVSLHLVTDPSAEIDPETAEMINALNDMQLVVESFKQQDWDTMSARGKLVVNRGEIPFQLTVDPTAMVMQIEGASVPIIVPTDTTSNPLSDLIGAGATNELTNDSVDAKAISQSLITLIVNNLANPQDISINNVFETVNGETVFLHKIHSDIKGPELFTLLKKSLRSLIKDDQGMKLFITQIYDVLKANATEEDDNLFGLGLSLGLSGSADSELEIEFIHTTIKQGLLIFLMMLEDESSELEWPFMTDDTYFASDLYVDSALNIRKIDFELSISNDLLEEADLEGIAAVQIEGHGQFWNHNKAITADTLPPYEDEDAFYMDDASSVEWIYTLDQQSVLYKLLRDDLHATRKTASFYADEEYSDYMSYELAIFRDGIMNVPARSLANDLGLQLDWNGVDRELTLTSPDGTTIVFKVDHNNASVNGADEIMPLAPFITQGQTYIPLRFVTDALGATIDWEAETQTATVTLE